MTKNLSDVCVIRHYLLLGVVENWRLTLKWVVSILLEVIFFFSTLSFSRGHQKYQILRQSEAGKKTLLYSLRPLDCLQTHTTFFKNKILLFFQQEIKSTIVLIYPALKTVWKIQWKYNQEGDKNQDPNISTKIPYGHQHPYWPPAQSSAVHMTYMKLFFHFAIWGQVKVKPISHFMCGCLDSFSLDFQFREVKKE